MQSASVGSGVGVTKRSRVEKLIGPPTDWVKLNSDGAYKSSVGLAGARVRSCFLNLLFTLLPSP
jgi:hypothetical protein